MRQFIATTLDERSCHQRRKHHELTFNLLVILSMHIGQCCKKVSLGETPKRMIVRGNAVGQYRGFCIIAKDRLSIVAIAFDQVG